MEQLFYIVEHPPLYIFSILTMIKIKNNESRSNGLSWKNNIMRRI